MRNRFLIIVLCLACTASFAQTTKKKGKGTSKPKTTKRVATNQPPVDTTKKTIIVKNASATSKQVATIPSKPFERPLDGYYKKNNVLNAKVTPLPNLRESDVVYSRRVWREIDLREKMNQYLASPKQRLIDVFLDAITAGELTAYDPIPTKDDLNGDEFSTPLTPDKAMAKLADSTVVNHIDKNGDKTGSSLVAGEVSRDSIIRFRIKEDVIFDKQRSVEEVRIIGIAPMIRKKVAGSGLEFDYQPAFWIYFPAARQVLVTKEAMNSRNDAAGLSFDDCFTKRLFSSYIVKVSNDKDERIKDQYQGIDRLYESERIKKTLMDWELNLWQY
jgi:gliding motility associated protien GldN